jgi:hypothetical protein
LRKRYRLDFQANGCQSAQNYEELLSTVRQAVLPYVHPWPRIVYQCSKWEINGLWTSQNASFASENTQCWSI